MGYTAGEVGITPGLARDTSGTITALNGEVVLDAQGTGTVVIQIDGTWVATLAFEATVNGVRWFPVNAIVPVTGEVVTTATANGEWIIASAGYEQIRVIATLFTSGTVEVSICGSTGMQAVSLGNAIPGGSGSIGTVNQGTGGASAWLFETEVQLDYDTGGGTQNLSVIGIALPASGGAVAGGTATNPIRIDPTGSTVQPVSGTVAATQSGSWTVTADAGTGTFVVDQVDTASLDYDTGGGTVNQTVLGIALPGAGGPVAGGTATNPVRTDPTGVTTQPVSGTVAVSSVGGTVTVSGTVTANAGTGTFAVDQINAAEADYDTGGGTVNQVMFGLALPASGGPVAGGTSTNPVRTDPTGVTTQPVSGTVTANQGTAAAGSGAWPIAITNTSDTVVKPGDAVNNAIRVNIVAGASSGGISQADRSTFTDGTTEFNPIGGFFNDSATNPTSGQAAAARITAKRAVHINLRDNSGNEIGIAAAPVRTDPTGTTAQPVTDNGGSLTVDGTVSISGTVTVDTELPAAAALSDVTENPTAPMVGAALMSWDPLAAKWRRVTGSVDSTGQTSVNVGGPVSDGGPIADIRPLMIGGRGPDELVHHIRAVVPADARAGYFGIWGSIVPHTFNGTDYDQNRSANAADNTSGTGVPATGNMLWSVGDTKWFRQAGNALGEAKVDTELPAAVALSDAISNPTTPMVGSGLMLWNIGAGSGSKWVRAGTVQGADQAGLTGPAPALAVGCMLIDTVDNAINAVRSARSMAAGASGNQLPAGASFVFDGASAFYPEPTANSADNTSGTGVPATGNLVWNAAASKWFRQAGSATGVPSFDLVGKAEDVLHVTGDAGLPVWTVRNDALGAGFLAGGDGDYQALQSTPKGDLRVSDLYPVVVSGTLTRPANTTTYTTNDELTDTGGAILTIAGCARYNGGGGFIDAITVIGSVNAATDPLLDIYVFDTTSTPAADNAAFAPSDAVMQTALIAKSLGTAQNGDTATSGNLIWQLSGFSIPFVCGAASTSLFVRFAVRNGYVPPSNSETYTVRLHIRQV